MVELVHRIEKGYTMSGVPNSHSGVEYLVRLAPDVEAARLPSFRYAGLYIETLISLPARNYMSRGIKASTYRINSHRAHVDHNGQ